MKSYTVWGRFVSWPEREESWLELETYSTKEEAIANASNCKNGTINSGYHGFKIVERAYSEKVVAVTGC